MTPLPLSPISFLATPRPVGFIDSFGEVMVVPIAGMIFAFGIVVVSALMKGLKEKLRQETIRQALDKGQPLPPELIEGRLPRGPRDDRRAGMISLAVGIGLFLFFWMMHESDETVPAGIAWVGCIPGLIGVALLLNWMLERGDKNGQSRQ